MSVLVNNEGINEEWVEVLSSLLPSLKIYSYPNIPDRGAIHYAVVWKHPQGDLKNYTHLKAIFSLGAGVDHLTQDRELPDVPIVRLVDPIMAEDMAIHTLHWVLHFHRGYHRYRCQEKEKIWEKTAYPLTENFKVGIMGLGNIGKIITERLLMNGYSVSGWSFHQAKLEGVKCFPREALNEFLADLSVVVCCLPLTPYTYELIDDRFFDKICSPIYFINISRGAIVKDQSLISALDREIVKAAALDVFLTEPLPPTSVYWSYPQVFVTPHTSGPTQARTAAGSIANNILRMERGEMPYPLYEVERGY